MMSRIFLVGVLLVLTLSTTFAVSMDAAVHRHKLHKDHKVTKHHTAKSTLKSKAHLRTMARTAVSALTSRHVLAMDHAVSMLSRTLSHMKSAMKTLRSHAIAKMSQKEKAGFVYADVVDSLNNVAMQPSCAALPYYINTCNQCVHYVHQCLNCVYDKPKVLPTIIPQFLLSNSDLPPLPANLPTFPDYTFSPDQYPIQQFPLEEQQQEIPLQQQEIPLQQQQEIPLQQQQEVTEQHHHHHHHHEHHHQHHHKQQQQAQQQQAQQQQPQQQEGVSHADALLNSLSEGLPALEQGLYSISTDVHKIQERMPNGVVDANPWPAEGDTKLSDEETLNNIAHHSDNGAHGPHLNHILDVVNSLQRSLPQLHQSVNQLKADMARINRYRVRSQEAPAQEPLEDESAQEQSSEEPSEEQAQEPAGQIQESP